MPLERRLKIAAHALEHSVVSSQQALLVFLLMMQIGAPTRQADSLSGIIVGQVIDAETGKPVSGAIVSMNGPVDATGMPNPRVLTGTDGRFFFRGLRRGSYGIFVYKFGYAEGAHGRTRPAGPPVSLQLADGERNGDVVIRVWKQASISGTVVDEAGERLIGVRVQAYRRTVLSGRRRYVPSGSALTDDRGIYRISGLSPGDYIVGAIARQTIVPSSMGNEIVSARVAGSTATAISVGRSAPGSMLQIRDAGLLLGGGMPTPPPIENGRLAVYPPTFHPSAFSADAATVIPLSPGAEIVSADLQVKPVSTVIISGHVVGPEGAVTMTPLRLFAAGTLDLVMDNDAMTTMTDRSGRFIFPAVPSGHYNLKLQRGGRPRGSDDRDLTVWTDVPLSVGTENVEDLMIEARPGVRIGGRVQFEGTSQAFPSSSVTVTVEAADPMLAGMGPVVVPARANSAGEFETAPLPGGRYYIRVPNSPSGWMFKSATVDGRDVVDTPVTAITDTLNVVVIFTDRWSGLRGFVQSASGSDIASAVLVFSTDSDTWGSSGASPRRVRLIRPNKSGEYSVNLPAGEYYAIAVPDSQTADWQDPAFLDAASRDAVRITIREGERKSQDLQARPVR